MVRERQRFGEGARVAGRAHRVERREHRADRALAIGGLGGEPHAQPRPQHGRPVGQAIEGTLLPGCDRRRLGRESVLADPEAGQTQGRLGERDRVSLPIRKPGRSLVQDARLGEASAGEDGVRMFDRERGGRCRGRGGALDRAGAFEQARRGVEAVDTAQHRRALPKDGDGAYRGVAGRGGRLDGMAGAAPDRLGIVAGQRLRRSRVGGQPLRRREGRRQGVSDDRVDDPNPLAIALHEAETEGALNREGHLSRGCVRHVYEFVETEGGTEQRGRRDQPSLARRRTSEPFDGRSPQRCRQSMRRAPARRGEAEQL